MLRKRDRKFQVEEAEELKSSDMNNIVMNREEQRGLSHVGIMRNHIG